MEECTSLFYLLTFGTEALSVSHIKLQKTKSKKYKNKSKIDIYPFLCLRYISFSFVIDGKKQDNMNEIIFCDYVQYLIFMSSRLLILWIGIMFIDLVVLFS